MALHDSIGSAVLNKEIQIDHTATMRKAIDKMAAEDVHALIVCQNGELVGILSCMDLMLALVAGRDPDATQVAGLMTSCDIITGDPAGNPCVQLDEDIDAARALEVMTEAGVRNLLVTGADNAVVGLITARDLLKIVVS